MIVNTVVMDMDVDFKRGLKYRLEQDDFKVDIVNNVNEGIKKLKKKNYDLAIIDILLLDNSGLNLLKTIREHFQIPIIVLTDKKEELTEILALEYGADDYINKSANFMVLKARIKAVLRRTNTFPVEIDNSIVKIDDFVINTVGRKISIKGRNITLTGKEFDLFYLLISNPGRVFTRKELLENIWGYDYYGDLRTVDVHIRRLREKIEEDSSNVEYIHTKWGKGYYFKRKNKEVFIRD